MTASPAFSATLEAAGQDRPPVTGLRHRLTFKKMKTISTLAFELPGISEKDVNITLQNNVLTVQGERKPEKKSEKGSWLQQECYYGAFTRSFTLPATINPDSVEATFNNGLLEVRIEKKAEAKPKQIQIGIGSKQLKGKAA